jgi:hypothetical protein
VKIGSWRETMHRLWLQLQSVSPHWPSVDVSSRFEERLLTGGGGGGDRPSSSALSWAQWMVTVYFCVAVMPRATRPRSSGDIRGVRWVAGAQGVWQLRLACPGLCAVLTGCEHCFSRCS